MRPARSIRTALISIMAAAVMAAGCAYTTVSVREKPPLPGPQVKAGLTAVMPPVSDGRQWPSQVSAQPIPNVRIFSEEITEKFRTGFVESGLFSKLDPPAPNTSVIPHPGSAPSQPVLVISMKSFVVANMGNNAWVAPHLLLNGALLPAFTGVLVATKGRVDSGAYVLPSTRLGTSIGAKLQYFEPGLTAPVLEKDYLVKVEMESISERTLLSSLEKGETYGVEIGTAEGYRTLQQFVETVSRDARWAYLPEFRRMVRAETAVNEGAPPAKQVETVTAVLDLIKPLAYTEEEVKVLRDGYLDNGPRATIANEMRAKFLNLASAKELPAEQVISEEQAEKLFTDPALLKAEVEAVLADRALALAVKVMTQLVADIPAPALTSKPEAKPAPQTFPSQPAMAGRPAPPEQAEQAPQAQASAPQEKKASASVKALSTSLTNKLADLLRKDPRLQALLIDHAEKAVGPAWAPMRELLEKINSPSTKKYLEVRSS